MKTDFHGQEKKAAAGSGMVTLLLSIFLFLVSVGTFLYGIYQGGGAGVLMVVLSILYWLVFTVLLFGFKVLKPNEAYVLTLFGKYYGTLKGPGFYFVNPFVVAAAPSAEDVALASEKAAVKGEKNVQLPKSKKISLKAMTLSNEKQKINDLLGNPIEIGIVVIWRVVNTAQAVFNVDNYPEFLSTQCDSALRNIVRMFPYDLAGDSEDSEESSLRGSSEEVSGKLKVAIQDKVNMAGLEILEARITHLAYAPEIAAAMLQRQQASAIIDARKMIVEGAVGMVELALAKLNEQDIVDLDEERKAAMVSNLLVVLCGNKDAQPIVNSGTLY